MDGPFFKKWPILSKKSTILYGTPCIFRKISWFWPKKKIKGPKSAEFDQKSTIFYGTPCIFRKISWFWTFLVKKVPFFMDHPVFFEKSADFGQEKKKRGKNQLILAQKSTIFYCTPCIFWKISWFSKKKAIRDGAYQFESSSETVQVSGETSLETVEL